MSDVVPRPRSQLQQLGLIAPGQGNRISPLADVTQSMLSKGNVPTTEPNCFRGDSKRSKPAFVCHSAPTSPLIPQPHDSLKPDVDPKASLAVLQQASPSNEQRVVKTHNPYQNVIPPTMEECLKVMELRRAEQYRRVYQRQVAQHRMVCFPGAFSAPSSPAIGTQLRLSASFGDEVEGGPYRSESIKALRPTTPPALPFAGKNSASSGLTSVVVGAQSQHTVKAQPPAIKIPTVQQLSVTPTMENLLPTLSSLTPPKQAPQLAENTTPSTPNTPTTPAPTSIISPNLTKVYSNGRPMPMRKEPEYDAVKFPYITVKLTSGDSTFANCAEGVLKGLQVIVECDRGIDIGTVVGPASSPAPAPTPSPADRALRKTPQTPTPSILRAATQEELDQAAMLAAEEPALLEQVQITNMQLLGTAMEIVRVNWQLDRSKLTIWYRSAERIHFVPLLKALHQMYHCRIWMERYEDQTSEQASYPASAQ